MRGVLRRLCHDENHSCASAMSLDGVVSGLVKGKGSGRVQAIAGRAI